jgi:opacity protein-like surface antigen
MRIVACGRSLGAVALGIVTAPSASLAQEYLRDGWYAGARGVYALVDFDAAGKAENTFGFNTFLGYRMWKMFGADLEIEFIPGVHVSGKGSPSYEVRTFNFGFNFRTYPFGRLVEEGSWLERVQPYLSAGIANQWVRIDDNPGNKKHQGDAAGRLGGGLDVYLTESLALTADARYARRRR